MPCNEETIDTAADDVARAAELDTREADARRAQGAVDALATFERRAEAAVTTFAATVDRIIAEAEAPTADPMIGRTGHRWPCARFYVAAQPSDRCTCDHAQRMAAEAATTWTDALAETPADTPAPRTVADLTYADLGATITLPGRRPEDTMRTGILVQIGHSAHLGQTFVGYGRRPGGRQTHGIHIDPLTPVEVTRP